MNLEMIGIPASKPGRQIALWAVSLVLMSIACWIGFQFDPHLADENHLMENSQALTLLLACLVHGWRASKFERSSVAFLLHSGLSLLMYSFLLRELEIREFDAAGQHFWAWTERTVRGIGWSLWVVYLVLFATRIRRVWAARHALLATPVVLCAFCAAVFMAAGWPFDKEKFSSVSPANSAFMEEILELNGYLILLAGSASATLQEEKNEKRRRS